MPQQRIPVAEGREVRSHKVAHRHRKLLTIILASVVPVGLLIAAGTGLAATVGQQNADQSADPNPDCTLIVPADPLGAAGLASPYQLTATDPNKGKCTESDAAQQAFVQATILDPATGALSVYSPLVIDEGSQPAAAPVTPTLPANAVVGVWFGFNGDNLTLQDDNNSLAAGNCVNGIDGSIFGQFAACGAANFFTQANAAVAAGKIKIPDIGTGKDGFPCGTTRDFTVVDQDQSDNVTATYLLLPDGAVAQNNAANQANLPGATPFSNGSDNGLLDSFLDPALGCTPFTAPDLGNDNKPATALALNELQAAAFQQAPIATVPVNDPMTRTGDAATDLSLDKTNLYRAAVDMAPLPDLGDKGAQYCTDLFTVGPERIQQDRNFTEALASPDPAAGTNLFTFLAQRLAASYDNLNCGDLITLKNPIKVQTNGDGVATGATFATPVDPVPVGGSPSPSASASAPASASASASAPASASASASPSLPPTSTAPSMSPPPSTSPAPTTGTGTAPSASASTGTGTGTAPSASASSGTGTGTGTGTGMGNQNTSPSASTSGKAGASASGSARAGSPSGTAVVNATATTPVATVMGLPVTGTPLAAIAGLALLLLGGGVLFVLMGRRRRRANDGPPPGGWS